MDNRLAQLHPAGVSVWLDSLDRPMLESGELARRIESDSLRGQTSNPTIFEKAISKGEAYDHDIKAGVQAGKSAEQICWELMVDDVQKACDIFRDLFQQSERQDGYVSLELDPTKAHDTTFSIEQGKDLWKRVERDNLMLKVPATEEGLPVVQELIYHGCNVNVTLLFAVSRYGEVIEAYLRGLERRVQEGLPVDSVASVASFFVSRVDSEVDSRLSKLEGGKALMGKAAVANARAAYALYQQKFSGPRWQALEAKGAHKQRPLWASTSTKNPDYPDTLYVDELIGPNCVNTMPDATIQAFAARGTVRQTLTAEHLGEAKKVLEQVKGVGVDMDDVTLNTLVNEGVEKFAQSYTSLLSTLESSMKQMVAS